MDVFEAQLRDYPPRLYLERSSNLEDKDINHNFHIREFNHVKEAIERDVSFIGVIAKLAGRKSMWYGRIVQYLLCRQLRVHKKEIWSLVVDQPIRMSFERAKRVFDDEAMMSYPWGRTAYEVIVDSITMLDPQGGSYTISGMKDVLLVWAYEPVRVRKMVMRDSIEEMSPQWPGEAEDPQLVNLITDIYARRFVRGFWEIQGNEKQKKKVKSGVSSEAEPPTKNQKKVKKEILSLTSEEEGKGDMVNNAVLMNIMSTLDNMSKKFDHHESRFETIESRLSANDSKRDMSNIDQKTIDAIVKAAVAVRLKVLGKLNKATKVKKTLVEDCVRGAATPASGGATSAKAAGVDFVYNFPAKAAKADKDAKDAKNKAGEAFGRGCRGKPKYQDALLKKEVTAKKRKKQTELKKQEAAVKEEVELKKQKVAQIKKEGVARTGTPQRANHSSLVEVTDKIRARDKELLSESDVEEEELIRSARIKEYQERKIYDPLALVDSAKLEKLMQHIKEIPPKSPATPTKKPLHISADFEGDFYSILMKERLWSDKKYGWMFDNHVVAYMKVLIGRSMQDPTPFWFKRIAFIDLWFITLWVHDYKQFKIKPNLMKFKGQIPPYYKTNLKWFEDVDHLYGVLQVSGDHWVMFHVDLKKEKIDCYDPIIGQVTEESETKMVVAFKLITQMLNNIIPTISENLVKSSSRSEGEKANTFYKTLNYSS
ncbi:hypothetical protein N665_0153s0011 [Sinapis alba]|nr:hypothetical protein N665_0153s0011 [Sinapis alba]